MGGVEVALSPGCKIRELRIFLSAPDSFNRKSFLDMDYRRISFGERIGEGAFSLTEMVA